MYIIIVINEKPKQLSLVSIIGMKRISYDDAITVR